MIRATPKQIYLGDGERMLLKVNGVAIIIERSMSHISVMVEGEIKEMIDFAEVNRNKKKDK